MSQLPELTFEEFVSLPLVYSMGIRYDDRAVRVYRNVMYGFFLQVETKFYPLTHSWGTGKSFYCLKGSKRIYKTIDQLYVAYMEKACGVKP